MVTTDHQVLQAYVVKSFVSSVTPSVGELAPIAAKINNQCYGQYVDPMGSVITTPKIDIKNIRGISLSIPHSSGAGKVCKIELNAAELDSSGNILKVGQDFLLRFEFKNWLGIGPAHSYLKYAVVHAVAGMSAADFYDKMVESINKNFAHEPWKPIIASTHTTNSASDYIIITPNPTNWKQGMVKKEYSEYVVSCDTVEEWDANNNFTGNSVTWGEVSVTSTINVPNIYEMADLEWATLKARADMYGLMGYPDVNPSKHVLEGACVGNDATANLPVLSIQYYTQEYGMNNQNSEKELMFIIYDTTNLDTLAKVVADDNFIKLINALGAVVDDAETLEDEDSNVVKYLFHPTGKFASEPSE